MKQITIEAVKTRNQDAGRFFFSPSTMSFFNSEPSFAAYLSDNGATVAFVDSVCQDPGRTPRTYKVRLMNWETGHVWGNRNMDYSSYRDADEAAEAAMASYDELSEAGAMVILPDTNRRAWFAAYGLPDSCHVHVCYMDGAQEFHVFSVAGEVGEFTPERAGEVMQEHTWTAYPSDL